ncbi:MAG: BlaI/MecI/CopY family transcriptional regulator [Bacteroidetes bacterium]|nr:BlaI/MecI/CopY family transcriptional regulator [Bacteroidota bacterium]
MSRRKHELSVAEWELMQVIWDVSGPVTVREVLETAYPNDEKAYTTVQTLMNILVDKGFLKRKKEGLVNRYTPAVRREKVLDASVSGVAERMFSGSFGAMASFLVSRKLSDEDIAALRLLLDEKEDAS